MIKSIFLLLKYGSFALINEIIIFFRRFAEVFIIGFDNLNYHVFQTIRLLRFENVRDVVFSTEGIVIITVSLLVIVILVTKKRF